MLAGLGRHQRLLWLWTKASVMLDWGSSTLDITTAGIVGTSYCCMVLCTALCRCWQCLLTVGGNLLLHTVTSLDVTTVAWCCRHTQDVLHPAECPPAALQTSEWQWCPVLPKFPWVQATQVSPIHKTFNITRRHVRGNEYTEYIHLAWAHTQYIYSLVKHLGFFSFTTITN